MCICSAGGQCMYWTYPYLITISSEQCLRWKCDPNSSNAYLVLRSYSFMPFYAEKIVSWNLISSLFLTLFLVSTYLFTYLPIFQSCESEYNIQFPADMVYVSNSTFFLLQSIAYWRKCNYIYRGKNHTFFFSFLSFP